MNVQTKMSKNVVYFYPNEPVKFAYAVMEHLGIRHLPVIEDGRLVGIISDRDIFKRSTWEDGKLRITDCSVQEVMTSALITCSPETTIEEAAEVMLLKKIDCLPVCKEGHELVGIITSSDLLNLLLEREGKSSRKLPFSWELRSYNEYQSAI